MEKKGLLIIVSGFAGTGKGTLMNLLLENYEDYVLSISATTRKPRPGEEEGRHYFFKTKEEFEQLIRDKGLLEYASYVGNYYGTPKAFVEEKLSQGKNVILEIEIQGALKVKELFPQSLLLFILPPSAAELKRRLEGRGTETEDVIAQRLKRACEEIKGIENYDYIVVNDDAPAAAARIDMLVKAALLQPVRQKAFIESLGKELEQL